MKTSKKLFLLFAFAFLVAMIYISYDISSKTTFPGSKPQLKERLVNEPADTAQTDTLRRSTE